MEEPKNQGAASPKGELFLTLQVELAFTPLGKMPTTQLATWRLTLPDLN